MADEPTIEEAARYAGAHARRIERTDPYFASVLRTLLASHASLEERGQGMEAAAETAHAVLVSFMARPVGDETLGDIQDLGVAKRALAAFVNEKERT